MHLYGMDVKEYLLTNKDIIRSDLAKRMWPNNKSADTYLSRKLNGERPFTKKDAILAKKALEELGQVFTAITIADSY